MENPMFEEVGCDEQANTEMTNEIIYGADAGMDDYIREYQEQTTLDFEDLVNMA
jgi:hypothetical protein